jgi:hypothetical protein
MENPSSGPISCSSIAAASAADTYETVSVGDLDGIVHCGAAEKAGAQLDAVAFGTRDERADATKMWTRLETHFELVLDPRRESAVRRTAAVKNRIVVVRSPPPEQVS